MKNSVGQKIRALMAKGDSPEQAAGIANSERLRTGVPSVYGEEAPALPRIGPRIMRPIRSLTPRIRTTRLPI